MGFYLKTNARKEQNMKGILAVALLALSFTTGFTCSKQAPEQAAETAAPAAPTEAAPTEAAPTEAAPTEAAPAAPTEAAPGSGN
jgi:hypothetical protein